MEALSSQASSFMMVTLTGVAWGIAFDIYHSRGPRSASRKGSDPRDLLFWLFSVCLVGIGLILSNWMELRLFVAVGLVFGYMIYAVLGRNVVQPILRVLNQVVDRIVFPIANLKNRLLIGGRIRRAMKAGGERRAK